MFIFVLMFSFHSQASLESRLYTQERELEEFGESIVNMTASQLALKTSSNAIWGLSTCVAGLAVGGFVTLTNFIPGFGPGVGLITVAKERVKSPASQIREWGYLPSDDGSPEALEAISDFILAGAWGSFRATIEASVKYMAAVRRGDDGEAVQEAYRADLRRNWYSTELSFGARWGVNSSCRKAILKHSILMETL